MNICRLSLRIRLLLVAVACVISIGPAFADQPADELKAGISLFDSGDYLKAQQALVEIDPEDLNDADRARRTDYLDRCQQAMQMIEKASRDIEEGNKALESGNLDQAETSFKAVLANEYASASIRDHAVSQLSVVATRRDGKADASKAREGVSVQTETKSETVYQVKDAKKAQVLIRQGHEALEGGRNAEAERLFSEALQLAPGHPDATDGLKRARSHMSNEVNATSILSDMKRTKQVRWNRTLAQFQATEQRIQNYVIQDNDYTRAMDEMLSIRQNANANKQYAPAPGDYQDLVARMDALQDWIEDQQTAFQERQTATSRAEIAEKQAQAQRKQLEEKQRQLKTLLDTAVLHEKNREYDQAIAVYREILAIQPNNDTARFHMKDLMDEQSLRNQRKTLEDKRWNTRRALEQASAALVPTLDENMDYPDNWLDMVNSPHRQPPGIESLPEEDKALVEKLDDTQSFNVEEEAFVDVIDGLIEDNNININVVWSDLESVDIFQDSPVTLKFNSPVKFRTILDQMLDNIGGGEVDLAFVVKDGLIKIATKEFLDRDVYVVVYPVKDLLMNIPDYDYDGPEFGINGMGGGMGGMGGGMGGGGMGGGGFGGGGGGFGGGGGGGFGGGGGRGGNSGGGSSGDDDDDDEDSEERIESLLELIRKLIEPGSWEEDGNGGTAYVSELDGQLVVRQTSTAHSEIGNLLSKLRQQRQVQIAIETRFLTVTANYLEEMGIDLDIILNQGNAGFDQATDANGNSYLMPRSMTRNGFMPGVPSLGAPLSQVTDRTDIYQPYGQAAFVPAPSDLGLIRSSRMTPIPIVSNVMDIAAPGPTSIDGTFGGNVSPALQVFGTFLDGIQVDFLVRATQADRRSSVVNAPRLVLSNGQRAWVGVLNNTSYVASVQPITDENAVAVAPNIGQLVTGVVLEVRATVSPDKRYVTMNLEPGVSEQVGSLERFPFSGGAAGGAANDAYIQTPSIAGQEIKTTVTVPDGGTLLFGGLKKTAEVEVEGGVPVLNKIPVLKRLYSHRSLVKDEQVLLILVKPTIIIQKEAEDRAFPTFIREG